MKAAELKNKSVAELKQELLELLAEQFKLRMQKETGQLQQTHQLTATRRKIARVKTVITQLERQ